MEPNSQKMCPNCHSPAMNAWTELTGEQQFLLERLPGSADFTADERKKHRFCTRCWFEDMDNCPVNT
jgi:RNA polymerase subunit RPABC4/transcription elongation factor Spt4